MFEYIVKIDKQITLLINSFSSEYIDYVMILFSNKYVWIPLYMYLIYFLYTNEKKIFLKLIVVSVLAVIISDFVTSSLMIPYFERLRPCNNPELVGIIDIVSGCGKKYGFASSHSSTTFSLATIFYFITKKRIQFLFAWSILVGYSRIYLGVHYFGDVIVGLFMGFLTSLIIYRTTYKLLK